MLTATYAGAKGRPRARLPLFWALLATIGFAMLPSCGAAKAPAVASPKVSPLDASGPESPLGASYPTVLYVSDPAPHIERLRGNTTLQGLFTLLEKANPGDAAEDDGFERVMRWVPVESAIGTNEAGAKMMDALLRVGLLFSLCEAAVDPEGANAPTEAAELQRLLAETLKGFRLEGLGVWARFRSPEDAAWLLTQVADAAEENLGGRAQIERTRTSLEVHLDVGRVLNPVLARVALSGMGLTSGLGDPSGDALADAVTTINLHARIVRDGAALRLDLGDPSRAVAAAIASGHDAPHQPGVGDAAAWGTLDARPWKRLSRERGKLLDQWLDTRAGAAARANDAEDMIGTLRLLSRTVDRSPDRLQFRLDIGAGRVDLLQRSEGDLPAPTLESTKVFDLIPAETQALTADTTTSLADLMISVLTRIEDRLARKDLQRLVGDDDSEGAKETSAAYYERLGRFRRLIYDEAPRVFEAPFVSLMGATGKVGRVAVQEGDGAPLVLSDLPVPTWAGIGRVTDAGRARRFLEEATRELVYSLAKGDSGKSPILTDLLREEDLGLGVPTRVFQPEALLRAFQSGAKVDLEGDLTLHFFFLDDYVVLSTSPSLSRSIIAAYRRQGPRLAPPAPGAISLAHMTGASMADMGDMLGTFLRALEGAGPAGETKEQDARAVETLSALTQILRLVDRIESISTEEGARREARTSLVLTQH